MSRVELKFLDVSIEREKQQYSDQMNRILRSGLAFLCFCIPAVCSIVRQVRQGAVTNSHGQQVIAVGLIDWQFKRPFAKGQGGMAKRAKAERVEIRTV